MRVGIVGAGLIGSRRAAVVAQTDGCRVEAVADTDFARAGGLAEIYSAQAFCDWQRLVTDPAVDAVVIATPNKFAMPVAVAAAANGKHILCEKPLGRTVSEALAIRAAARENHVTLKTGFNHRHHPSVLRAHAHVSQGGIGAPCFLRCVYGHGGRPGYENEWRGNADLAGGGELLDQGVHVVDLARWFLGEFVEVMGVTTRCFWPIEPLEDNGFALMRTRGGQVASLHTSWTQWRNRFSFEVFGRDGYVRLEGLGGSYGPASLILGRRRPESGPPDEQRVTFEGPDQSWSAEWLEFLAAISEGREPIGSGTDGVEALRLIEAVYGASRTGSTVRVADLPS
jgi:predicted dehydrogenase